MNKEVKICGLSPLAEVELKNRINSINDQLVKIEALIKASRSTLKKINNPQIKKAKGFYAAVSEAIASLNADTSRTARTEFIKKTSKIKAILDSKKEQKKKGLSEKTRGLMVTFFAREFVLAQTDLEIFTAAKQTLITTRSIIEQFVNK